jgi:hypothetical protein
MIDLIKKFAPQTFNDLLALISIILILAVWIVEGIGYVVLYPEVNGALIVTWTLIVQFYFRKAKTEE